MEFMVAIRRFPHVALQAITPLAGNNAISICILKFRVSYQKRKWQTNKDIVSFLIILYYNKFLFFNLLMLYNFIIIS